MSSRSCWARGEGGRWRHALHPLEETPSTRPSMATECSAFCCSTNRNTAIRSGRSPEQRRPRLPRESRRSASRATFQPVSTMAPIRRLSEGHSQITWLEGYVVGPDSKRRQRRGGDPLQHSGFTISPTDSALEARALLARHGIEHLVVMDGTSVVGALSKALVAASGLRACTDPGRDLKPIRRRCGMTPGVPLHPAPVDTRRRAGLSSATHSPRRMSSRWRMNR